MPVNPENNDTPDFVERLRKHVVKHLFGGPKEELRQAPPPVEAAPQPKKVDKERHVLLAQIYIQRDYVIFDDGTHHEGFTAQTITRAGTKPEQTETGDDRLTGRIQGVISGATQFAALMQNLVSALIQGHQKGDINLLTDNCLAKGTTIEEDNKRTEAEHTVSDETQGPPQPDVVPPKEHKTKFIKRY